MPEHRGHDPGAYGVSNDQGRKERSHLRTCPLCGEDEIFLANHLGDCDGGEPTDA